MTQYQTLLLPDDIVKPGAFNTLEWFSHITKKVDFKDKDVVDYGCAEGVMSLLAKKSGARKVTGIDKDAERIQQAVDLAIKHKLDFSFYNQSLCEQKIHADIGIFSLIIHWLDDPQKDLRGLLRRIDETAVILFREKNSGYQKQNGNWFPTLEELDTYMKSCSFTCSYTKLLQTQDNGKNIYLKVFKRTKNVFFTTDERYVIKVGVFREGWKEDFKVLKERLELPVHCFGEFFYMSRRIIGNKICDDVVKKEVLQSFILKYEAVFRETGLMFTDMSPGNILFEPTTGYHLIDFDDIGEWDENNERWNELVALI